jgi:hypothetical protein
VRDPHTSRFAAHVHEVVGLHEQDAPFEAVEECIDSLTVDMEEQSALWLLAWSLRNGATIHRGVGAPAGTPTHA